MSIIVSLARARFVLVMMGSNVLSYGRHGEMEDKGCDKYAAGEG